MNSEIERLERAIQELEDHAYHHSMKPTISAEAHALSLVALMEKLEREKPHPLTLDELRGMDGEPVWVVTLEEAELNPPYWAIVDTAKGSRSRGTRLVGVEEHEDFGAYELYGKTWTAYAQKPDNHPGQGGEKGAEG